MPDLPAFHGWTHRPKAQGGTDPVDFPAAGGTWATAYGAAAGIVNDSNDYFVPILQMWTNDTAGYEPGGVSGGEADWLQINTQGFYRAEFSITIQPGEFESVHIPRITPIFSLGGTPAGIQANMGPADFPGNRFTSMAEQLDGHDEHSMLYSMINFNWDPGNTDSGDLNDQDPLQISANLTSVDYTATLTLTLRMYVQRISDAGYTDVSP